MYQGEDPPKADKPSNKRTLESASERSPKKAKQSSTFSSLLKKVSTSSSVSSPPANQPSDSNEGGISAAEAARLKAQQRSAELIAKLASVDSNGETKPQKTEIKPGDIAKGTYTGLLAVVNAIRLFEPDLMLIVLAVGNVDAPKKLAAKRVKWADHFGGKLESAHEIEGMGSDPGAPIEDGGEGALPVSWTDRKKRDRLREKELLAKAK